jgi:hypothetical protein
MTDTNTQNNQDAPTWFIDEGMPGTGPRPAWLPDKFKNVSDLGKSFTELEKRLGHVPEEYDFKKSKHLNPEYAPFVELQQLAKEKRTPKDVMDKVIDSVDKFLDETRIDPNKELAKLGDNGKERIELVDNWAKANLSKESFEALANGPRTAESIKALEELRGKMMSNTTQIPTGNNGSVNTTSLEDLKLELQTNLVKYKEDPKYREDLQKRLEVAAKNTPGFVDKVGA